LNARWNVQDAPAGSQYMFDTLHVPPKVGQNGP
jgi:hypothetical protein